LRTVALLMIGCVLPLAAADATASTKKKNYHTKKRSSVKSAKAPTTTKTGKGSTKHAKASAKRGKSKSAAANWRSRQLAPTADRYKEIQSALAQKGYLNQSPNGVWDTSSSDALRRFQQDQNLEPTGKLNSLSLIALGLGAKRGTPAGGVAPPPPAFTPHAPLIDSPPPLPGNAIPQSPTPFAVPEPTTASPPPAAR
jgi:Putative peptidoglycan binding domain